MENEDYINVDAPYWENRYYETVLRMERSESNLRRICMNYLEGLIWNMEYYTLGCKIGFGHISIVIHLYLVIYLNIHHYGK